MAESQSTEIVSHKDGITCYRSKRLIVITPLHFFLERQNDAIWQPIGMRQHKSNLVWWHRPTIFPLKAFQAHVCATHWN